jgi:hypothetical protein
MFSVKNVRKGKTITVTGRGSPQSCETSRFPHFLDNRLSDGGEDVSLTLRPPFTLRKNLVLISAKGSVDTRPIVRMEGLGQLKNPSNPSGIEPATFRFVAYCLNQLLYRPFSVPNNNHFNVAVSFNVVFVLISLSFTRLNTFM